MSIYDKALAKIDGEIEAVRAGLAKQYAHIGPPLSCLVLRAPDGTENHP